MTGKKCKQILTIKPEEGNCFRDLGIDRTILILNLNKD
jgi:hypothetical protein